MPQPDKDPYYRGEKTATPAEAEMHICRNPECRSELVQPLEWSEISGQLGSWTVVLRCPNCEEESTDIFSTDEIEAFDRELELGARELIAELRVRTREVMEPEIERFSGALAAGHILPEDF